MAKYCTKCGKKLEEGEVCNCTKKTSKKTVKKEEVVKEETVVASTTTTAPANDYVNQYLEVAKGIFTNPVDTMKKFAKSEYFTLGLIMIAINCFVTVLFAYLGFKEIASNMRDMQAIFSYTTSGYYMDASLSVEVLIKLFVMIAGGFASTAMMLYVMASPVFKTKADMKQLFSLVGVCSVFTTITTLIALVCMYFSANLMFIILVVCGLTYLIHLYHGFLSITEVEKNRIGYAYIVAISVATFVVLYLLPKILF